MKKNYKTKKEEMENGKIAGNAVVFENPEFGKIRTLTDENGEPLFCAKDVCDILGYKKSRNAVNQLVNHLDALKQGVKVSGSLRKDGSRTVRTQQMLFVNESGFYALVLGSKLPTAVKFKNWVTSEVLPQIRKTGGYIPVQQGESDEETIRHAEEILRATLKEKENLLKNQRVQIEQQKKLIGEQDTEIRRLNGAVDAVNTSKECFVYLVGKEDVVNNELSKYTYSKEQIEVVNATEVIETGEPPVMAIRHKKDSSLVKALNMVKNKEADAFVSAGSSGAILVGGQVIVGRLPGVERPPIGAIVPCRL